MRETIADAREGCQASGLKFLDYMTDVEEIYVATKAESLADQLRTAIKAGDYQPGQSLPTLTELAASAGIARATVIQAVKILVREGLVETRPKSGTRVLGFRRYAWPLEAGRSVVPDADPWAAEVRSQGREPSETIEVLREVASASIADALSTSADDLLVVRRRRRYVDGRLVQVSTSYFASALAVGTPLEHPASVQMTGGVLSAIGRPQDRVKVEVVGDMPTKEEQAWFDGLGASVPAFYVTHLGVDAAGEPLRLMRTIAPCDRNTLTLVIEGLS